jgi:DNA repair exonuclease SbcCD nuclease subunit
VSQTSHDARAVVRAIDALTTQVRRLADAQPTPVVEHVLGEETACDDACRPVEVGGETIRVRGSGDFTDEERGFVTEIVRAAKRKYEAEHTGEQQAPAAKGPDFTSPLSAIEVRVPCPDCPPPAMIPRSQITEHIIREHTGQAPAADEDAQRTTRRDSLRNLIDRLDRNGALAYDEGALLRQHVEAEMRESDQWRAGRNTMKQRGEEIERNRDNWQRRAEQAEELLRVAHETSNRSETERARAVQRAEWAERNVSSVARALARGDRYRTAWRNARARARKHARSAERAEAVIERVRHLADRWDLDAPPPGNRPLTELRAALDGTEQP